MLLTTLCSRLPVAAALLALGATTSALFAGTSGDLHTRMRQGINYGNYYDGGGAASETSTTVAAIPQWKFTAIKNAGFEHVRLSVCWGYRLQWPTTNYYEGDAFTTANTVTVNNTFMASVVQSVRNARNAGLIVILDTHHEDWFQQYWSNPATRNTTIKPNGASYITSGAGSGGRTAERIFKDLWKDIFNNFKNETLWEDVIFEVLNEPRKSDIGTFTDADLNTLNDIIFGISQDTAYRNFATTRRVMMLAVNDANNVKSLKPMVLPTKDGMTAAQVRDQCIVTIHYYFPNSFTHYTAQTVSGVYYPATKYWGNGGNANDYPDMDSRFALMQNTTAANFNDPNMVGIKINIGEFGVVHTDGSNGASLQRWYTGVMSRAATRGLTTTVWCDAGDFGVFNQGAGNFTFTGDKAYRNALYDYVNN